VTDSVPSPPPIDLPPLTILRFFAALWVVFHHQQVYWPWPSVHGVESVKTILEHGNTGVKIFFILSGFILTFVYQRKGVRSMRGFLVARFARIYPLYLVGLALSIPSLFLIDLPEQVRLSGAALGTGTILAKGLAVLLLLQAWIPAASNFWNGVSWSLSAEAFFYLCFPFLLRNFLRMPSRWIPVLLALLASIEVAREYVVVGTTDRMLLSFLYFNPVLRMADFATGVLIGVVYARGGRLSPWWALAAAGCLVAGNSLLAHVVAARVLLVHAGSAALVLSLAFTPRSSESLWIRTGVLLGQASYAVYLIHQPLAYLYNTAVVKIFGTDPPYLSYLAVLVATSAILYTFVESPAREWIRRRFS